MHAGAAPPDTGASADALPVIVERRANRRGRCRGEGVFGSDIGKRVRQRSVRPSPGRAPPSTNRACPTASRSKPGRNHKRFRFTVARGRTSPRRHRHNPSQPLPQPEVSFRGSLRDGPDRDQPLGHPASDFPARARPQCPRPGCSARSRRTTIANAPLTTYSIRGSCRRLGNPAGPPAALRERSSGGPVRRVSRLRRQPPLLNFRNARVMFRLVGRLVARRPARGSWRS
jgi:hypothetical protein